MSDKIRRTYESVQYESSSRLEKEVEKAYKRFQETQTFEYPEWLFGPPKGKLFKVEVGDKETKIGLLRRVNTLKNTILGPLKEFF